MLLNIHWAHLVPCHPCTFGHAALSLEFHFPVLLISIPPLHQSPPELLPCIQLLTSSVFYQRCNKLPQTSSLKQRCLLSLFSCLPWQETLVTLAIRTLVTTLVPPGYSEKPPTSRSLTLWHLQRPIAMHARVWGIPWACLHPYSRIKSRRARSTSYLIFCSYNSKPHALNIAGLGTSLVHLSVPPTSSSTVPGT